MIGPDGTPGFDLWVGGGLSTNPKFAQRLGVFVEPDEVAEVWAGVTAVFRDYGYRRSRNHARLKFLIADWGPSGSARCWRRSTSAAPLPDGPAPERVARASRPRRASTEQVDGSRGRRRDAVGPHLRHRSCADRRAWPTRYGPGRESASPRSRAGRPGRPAGPDRRAGRRSWRPRACRCARAVPARHDGLHRDRVLQARDRRDQGAGRRSPASWSGGCRTSTRRSRINVNGCPNSCARFQVADIGFKGRSRAGPTARTSRPSRCTSAGTWAPRPRSVASSAASRSRRTAPRTTSSGCCGATWSAASPRRASPRTRPGPTRRGCQ